MDQAYFLFILCIDRALNFHHLVAVSVAQAASALAYQDNDPEFRRSGTCGKGRDFCAFFSGFSRFSIFISSTFATFLSPSSHFHILRFKNKTAAAIQ